MKVALPLSALITALALLVSSCGGGPQNSPPSQPSLVSIAISPAESAIALGTTGQFLARGTFSDGSTRDITSSVSWSLSSSGIATLGNSPGQAGLARSIATGSVNVEARSGAISGTAALTVTPAALVQIAVTPSTPSIALGMSQLFAAMGTFTDGTTQNITSLVAWASSAPAVASIDNAGSTTSLSAGQANVSAGYGLISGSATLNVGTSLPIAEFPVSTSSAPSGICAGPEGAVWFTEETANRIGRIASDGTITEFDVPTPNAGLGGITMGPDSNLYFTEFKANKVGRLDPVLQQFTEWNLPQVSAGPGGIVTGSDGNLWIMEAQANSVAQMTTSGKFIGVFNIPTLSSWPHGPTLAGDGNVWFAELNANGIASITPAGVITEFVLPQPNSSPDVLTSATEGVYFSESNSNEIGWISVVDFSIRQWALPTANSSPVGLTVGADGSLYFVERLANNIGILPKGGGQIYEYPIPTPSAQPDKVTLGPDGRVWFSEHNASQIGRLF